MLMTGNRTRTFRSGRELVERLRQDVPLWAVELRPPRRAAGAAREGVESWIDLYHAIRRLTATDTLVFTTDNATGAREEENLRHLHANLGPDADLSRVVPFLTVKHPLEYCLRFPERANLAGHRAVVVLGGDTHDGVPRCVPHASELRRRLRERYPSLALGGWANPYRDPAWQVDLLKRAETYTDFVLTQVVSHHDFAAVERFVEQARRVGLTTPILAGVFYYRSGNPKTLAALRALMPVPVEALSREFGEERLSPTAVCRRTLTALADLGIRHVYLCNLPAASAVGLVEELRAGRVS
jgi:5,10-methylenetetrahydrofolate reductase